MSRSHYLPLLLVALLSVLRTPALALDTDFVVYDGHLSYSEGFREAWSVDLMDQYMALYTENMDRFIGLWPNSHTLSAISIPVLGRPQKDLLVGTSFSMADLDESAKTGVGMTTLDRSPGNWPNTMLYASLPLEQVSAKFSGGAWRDAEATLKASILSFAIVDNIRISTLTLGLGLRKEVWGRPSPGEKRALTGMTVSGGFQYSRFFAREDDLYINAFADADGNLTRMESVSATGGEILVSIVDSETLRADYEEQGSALLHVPYIEAHMLAFDVGAIAYATPFKWLGLFTGLGVAFLPINLMHMDSAVEVNIKVTNGTDEESHDGELSFNGTVYGSMFMPRYLVGVQFGTRRVRWPIQLVQTLQGKRKMVRAVSTGISVSL